MPEMKKLLSITVLSAAFALAQTSPMQSRFQQPGWIAAPNAPSISLTNPLEVQSGPVQGRPFSGTEIRHTTQTLADGTHVEHSDTTQLYRDAQGRMRAETPNRVFIYDPVAGFTADLFPSEKNYEKMPLKDGTVVSFALAGSLAQVSRTTDQGRSSQPRARWSNGEVLGTQFIGGVQVKGSRVTSIIPAGTFGNDRDIKVVNERWYSDDLQVLVKSVNNDPRFGISTYVLTNIVQTPPDTTLFQIPVDYTEHRRH
jgi:hypothetical protein